MRAGRYHCVPLRSIPSQAATGHAERHPEIPRPCCPTGWYPYHGSSFGVVAFHAEAGGWIAAFESGGSNATRLATDDHNVSALCTSSFAGEELRILRSTMTANAVHPERREGREMSLRGECDRRDSDWRVSPLTRFADLGTWPACGSARGTRVRGAMRMVTKPLIYFVNFLFPFLRGRLARRVATNQVWMPNLHQTPVRAPHLFW